MPEISHRGWKVAYGQTLVMTARRHAAGLELDIDALNAQLRRRQGGYGRGRRMQIESDRAEILAGVRTGVRPARRSRCSFAIATGSTGSRRCTSSGDAGGRQRREAPT
jgi:hypothetical protein